MIPWLTSFPFTCPVPLADAFTKHGQLSTQGSQQCRKSKRRPTGLPLFELSQIREEGVLPRISRDESMENLIITYAPFADDKTTTAVNGGDKKVNFLVIGT